MKPPSPSRGHDPDASASASSSASSFPSSKAAASDSVYQEGDVSPPYAAGTDKAGPFTDEDMAASVAALESLLGYTFRDPRLAEEALTHPSTPRLEFMGIAVYRLLVVSHLLNTDPDADAGCFSILRAANVSTEKLARVALRHGLYRHLRRRDPSLDAQVAEFAVVVEREEDQDAELAVIYGGASVKAPTVLADMVKSVVGAVTLDTRSDMMVMWRACRGLLDPVITLDTFHEQPVSVLNRLCQQRGWSLEFKNWCKEDRAVVNALVDGDLVGIGSSDQEHLAKLNAAHHALQELSLAILEAQAMREKESVGGINIGGDAVDGKEELTDEKGMKLGAGEVFVESNPAVIDSEGPAEMVEGAKMKLNTICENNHWPPPVYSIDRKMGPPHVRRYICSVRVETPEGVYEESGGIRLRKKQAKNAAASQLIKALTNGLSASPRS